MHPEGGRISIWFFIGGLVLVYGALIFGAGLYDLIAKHTENVVMANLHAGIWWGMLMMVLGGYYTYRFFPSQREP